MFLMTQVSLLDLRHGFTVTAVYYGGGFSTDGVHPPRGYAMIKTNLLAINDLRFN
jgi:hypothetical protein